MIRRKKGHPSKIKVKDWNNLKANKTKAFAHDQT